MNDDWLLQIPEGKSGDWSVERFEVSEDESQPGRLRAVCNLSAMGRYVPPGTYTALKRCGATIMSTTPDELRDFRHLRRESGDGLIAGLGLGCSVTWALQEESVGTVTVVEFSPDVIRLVGPTLQKTFMDRIRIVEADIFAWKPPAGSRWDWAYYDIWDDICLDNLPEMTRLKRKFGRRVKHQTCWCEELLRAENRRENRYMSVWR